MKKVKTISLLLLVGNLLMISVNGFATESLKTKENQSEDITASKEDRTNKFKPVILPFYDPSIKAGIMAVPVFAFYPDDTDLVSDASTIAIPLIYTSNDSYVAKIMGDIILKKDRFRINFETGITSTNFTLAGVDNNRDTIDASADFMFKVYDNIFLGVGGIYTSTRYSADNPAEQIILESMGFSENYSNDSGYRLSMQWDTREHFYYPHSGFVWQLNYENHAKWLGNDSDNTYSSVFSDFRHFLSINGDSNNIIASKLVGRYLIDSENAPSSSYSTYGRQGREIQRGFKVGEYVASDMVNLEMEYRHKLTEMSNAILNKSTLVVIWGMGRSFGETLENQHQSFVESDRLSVIGVGYRYTVLPYERLNITVDLTHNSDGDSIIYFGFGESI